MPDGYSLSLDQFKGLNQTGDAGSVVNNHYLRISESPSHRALGAVAQSGTSGPLTRRVPTSCVRASLKAQRSLRRRSSTF